MAVHTDKAQPKHLDELLSPAAPYAAEQVLHDIQAVNEQLLIAGLREQTLAEQLRRQLAFTTAITTSLGEGVFVLDSAGRCTFVNPAAEHMLGWTSDELHGQDIGVLFGLENEQQASTGVIPEPVLEVLRSGTAYRNEDALFVHRDGSRFPTAYSVAPIITDGHIVGAVITFRDMTTLRRLQRTREEYLALISHDLRAPLTTILGRAGILVRRLTKQGLTEEAHSAKILVESSHRMDHMIEDLLRRSRADADSQAQPWTAVDLVVVVQHMIDQTLAPDDSRQITFDSVPTLPVVIEVAQIERVIVNLLANALKFSPHDTPIVVRVYQQDGEAIVAVTDQGIGIGSEDLPHLFGKHFRAQTAEQIAGNGLGLYSSRLIAEAHGGRLWAESAIGVGSTFTLALPQRHAA